MPTENTDNKTKLQNQTKANTLTFLSQHSKLTVTTLKTKNCSVTSKKSVEVLE